MTDPDRAAPGEAPVTDRPRRRVPPVSAVAGTGLAVLTVAVAAAAVVVHRVTGRFGGDLAAIRAAAAAAGRGDGRVYQLVFSGGEGVEFGFTYPPFAALLFRPLAEVSLEVAIGGWTFGSMLALVAVVWLSVRAAGVAPRHRWVWTLVATAAALPMLPVSGHLQAGQVNLLLVLLVLLDLTGDPRRRRHGLAIGVAAGVKLIPLIFVVYLLLTGRVRATVTAVAGFLGTVAVGFAWRPADSWWFWTGGMFDPSRVAGDPRTILNQSLRGTLARLADTGDPGLLWLPVAVVVAGAGLAVAGWCARTGDPVAGLLACATTGLLVSPVSWHHYWVWAVPALVVSVHRCRQARHRAGLVISGLGWLVAVATTSWVLAGIQGWDLHFHGWQLIYSDLYVLVGLAGLGWLALHRWRLTRTGADAAPAAAGAG